MSAMKMSQNTSEWKWRIIEKREKVLYEKYVNKPKTEAKIEMHLKRWIELQYAMSSARNRIHEKTAADLPPL